MHDGQESDGIKNQSLIESNLKLYQVFILFAAHRDAARAAAPPYPGVYAAPAAGRDGTGGFRSRARAGRVACRAFG